MRKTCGMQDLDFKMTLFTCDVLKLNRIETEKTNKSGYDHEQ